jgi:hypothetical protein
MNKRYLQLEQHLIPILLIKYVSQREEEGLDDDGVTPVRYVETIIILRDGEELIVSEEFEVVCALLNQII